MLQVYRLNKYFGGLNALNQIDLTVFDKEILGIIGPNGAGKTTLLNVINGYLKPSSGEIIFNGKNITGLQPHDVARLGIARTFQIPKFFMNLSLVENVIIGFHLSYSTPVWKRLLHVPSTKREEKIIRQKAIDILRFAGLGEVINEPAFVLPYGFQKALSICTALAVNPKLLLLDEPLAGLNEKEANMMMDLIRNIQSQGTSVVIVEHNIKAIMSLCDRIIVLSYGKKIAEGSPDEVKKNKEVIEVYLGSEDF